MADKEKHLSEKDLEKNHTRVGGRKGGSCLRGHESKRIEGNSCSYRWQAHERAKDEKDLYESYKDFDFDQYKKGMIPTLAFPPEKPAWPASYCVALDIPSPGDWDVAGPEKDVKRARFGKSSKGTIEAGTNFYGQIAPYWNNAHHIIPKGTLNAMIDEQTKDNSAIGIFIKNQLLIAKYNINEDINMMLLPEDYEVAKILGLPRHRTHAQVDDDAEKGEEFNHARYNTYVEGKLQPIIDGYKAKFKKRGKPHPEANPELTKAELEALSDALRKEIIGSTSGGKKGGKDKKKKGASGTKKQDIRGWSLAEVFALKLPTGSTSTTAGGTS
jgi:hypothetical protein